MINELGKLDHALLDENRKCMLMLIFDHDELWMVEKPTGLKALKYSKMLKDKNLDHLIFFTKKIENYIDYIQNGGILISFPNCIDYGSYTYEIRVVTNNIPSPDYLDCIDKMNKHIAKQISNIVVTHEILSQGEG